MSVGYSAQCTPVQYTHVQYFLQRGDLVMIWYLEMVAHGLKVDGSTQRI